MKPATRKWLKWLMITLGGATMFQGVGFTSNNGAFSNGCSEFYANGAVTSVDFCYLLDCQNGFFGGLVDPCAQGSLLVDCPGGMTTDEEEAEEEDTTTSKTVSGNGAFGF
jgi:hypothetical protein